MMKLNFLKKDRALGVSEKHTYDIPLDKGTGRIFLTSLIGLMVFLALLSVAAAFILNNFANQWQTGLEGRWTIEIPAIDESGELIERNELYAIAGEIIGTATNFPAVTEATLLEDNELLTLIEPWFGTSSHEQNFIDDLNLPLPILISLNMNKTDIVTATDMADELANTYPLARLDRHEVWLEQLLKLTGTLRFSALVFTLTICIAGIVAIAGAMQSRLAEHRESIELLHLMGASDAYISKQFERHSIVMSIVGGGIGFVATLLFIFILKTLLGGNDSISIPGIELSPVFWGTLICVPIATLLICFVTTRWTILRTLRKML